MDRIVGSREVTAKSFSLKEPILWRKDKAEYQAALLANRHGVNGKREQYLQLRCALKVMDPESMLPLIKSMDALDKSQR